MKDIYYLVADDYGEKGDGWCVVVKKHDSGRDGPRE